MNKDKVEDLGVIVKKHPSGLMETDKGVRTNQGAIGDTLKRKNRKMFVVKKGEYTIKYQTGVTKALRAAAEKIGFEVTAETTKEAIESAIAAAEQAGGE